jgi:hypothetical protein
LFIVALRAAEAIHPVKSLKNADRSQTAALEPFYLSIFEVPPIEQRPANLSWEALMRETELVRRYYLDHYDTPKSASATRIGGANPFPRGRTKLGEGGDDPLQRLEHAK